jgi:peroxiredoxin
VSGPHPLVAALEVAFQRSRMMDAPLSARLRVVADEVRALSTDFAEAVDAFVGRLERAGAGEGAPKVGDQMPPFILPDETGRLVSLTDLLTRSPVAVSFHRGHWCPYCRLNAGALAEVEDQIKPVQLVAISAERRPYTETLKAESGATFPFLTDSRNGYALSLNLAIWVDDKMSGMIAGAGWDVPAYQGDQAWILPVPAVFIVDQDGIVRARHVDPDYRRRMEMEDLLAAARALSRAGIAGLRPEAAE